MALSKTLDLSNNALICSYWRIGAISIDMNKAIEWFTLTGYKDEATRLAGKQWGYNRRITIRPAPIEYSKWGKIGLYETLYGVLKAMDILKDASDLLNVVDSEPSPVEPVSK